MHNLGFLAFSAESDRDDSPAERPLGVGDLLREWRAAERSLAEADPGSDVWTRLKADVEHIRARYQEAFDSMSNSDPTGSSA
jgi:hypothetical protein